MRRLFDMENPLWQGLGVIADMVVLNLLTLLGSIPVVTMGAALTAMNDVVIRIVRQEEGSIFRGFWRAFRQNLKKGVPSGILILLAAGILYVDYLCALAFAPMLRYGIAALAVLLLALVIYVFALLARYENRLGATIRNAAILAVGYFPRTLGMVCFCMAFWALCIRFFRYGAPILLMFGFSLPCYICVILMRGIFEQLEKGQTEKEENPDV